MNTYAPFSAATDWPSEPLPGLPEPPNHFDDLDGLTREELVAQQIAKRRELLQPAPPDVPVNRNVRKRKILAETKR